ncbi:metalloendoproteinase 3-MMP-like [Euphorbia lathyris]|uniref:metalloendoproteinase 3-MMP-like n=1 Tax=Euphorbia lathyris TaxID=212925 RepID=UPI0033132168
MASKTFSSFPFILLISISLISSIAFAASKDDEKPSSFNFLKHVQGSHKGENVKGIQGLKKYLQHFGYLNYQNQSLFNNDDFDNQLESAIKTYQINFHLNPTGILDSETVSQMMLPRCGVADIINGNTRMESNKQSNKSKFKIVSHYAFLPGLPRWPLYKYHLTYGFQLNTPPAAVAPVKRAFKTWEANSQFTFEITEYYDSADLKVNFYRGEHGDGFPFDGPEGILAHGMPPRDGRLHFDADEKWVVGKVDDGVDIETVALHEIGHLLGLGHSSVEDAIMFPTILPGVIKGMNYDDIQGIKALYSI